MKKRVFISVLFVLGFVSVLKPQASYPFSLGTSILPSWNDVMYKSDGSNGAESVMNALSGVEIPFYTVHGGVDFHYNISNQWYLATGAYHFQTGMNTTAFNLLPAVPDPAIPANVYYHYRYKYLSLPVETGYYIFGGFFIQGGIGVHFLYERKYTRFSKFSDGHEEEDEFTDNSTQFAPVMLTGNLRLGYTFNKNGIWNFSVGSFGSIGITCIAESVPLNRRMLTAGLTFSARYNF